jgi:tetratricopeptide (TPR) repeat protein
MKLNGIAYFGVLVAGLSANASFAQTPPVAPAADAPPTHADDDEPQPMMGVVLDDEAARGHFQVAQALFQTGRYVEAGGEFEQAYELSHRTEMLFNAFVAFRDAAELERAAEVLTRYLDLEPESPGTLQLRARLIRMQARVAEQNEVEAERQRALVGQAEAEHERQVAEARAEAERQRADEASTASTATRQAWVVAASGGGLILASGVMALIAKSRVDDLEASCPNNRCGAGVDLSHDRDRARRVVIATDALWMTGAVVAGLGFVLLLTADSGDDEPENANGVGAFCDGHGCAASYRRSF